ncbi:MAG: site-specific DNA-methyltransferase [Sandaracinus sp.]
MSSSHTSARDARAPVELHAWLVRSDAVAFLSGLPDASVDLVVTDPPYESLEKHRAVGTTTRLSHSKSSSNDWFTVFPNSRFEELFAHIYRVLRKDTHFYLFCDQETAFVAKPVGEKVGFKFWKPLVWDKEKIGMGYHYRSRYELILFFEKGKRRLADLGVADVLRAPRIHKGYPTEKPVSLNKVLVSQSSEAGEIVIDPFMGTASAGSAALSLGRSFWGSDISDKAMSIARERLGAIEIPGAEARVRFVDTLPAANAAVGGEGAQLGLFAGSDDEADREHDESRSR